MVRKILPNRRPGWTQKVKIDGNGFYLRTGHYPDGKLGELFIDASKEGTFSRGVLGGLARVLSISLQNETPLEELVRSLRHLNFPPNGKVEGEFTQVTTCTSVLDWVVQELEFAYLGRTLPSTGYIQQVEEGDTHYGS